jgi:two-component system CheB/CheR fusion protein
VDTSGRIVLSNTSATRVFGYAPDELIGRNVDALLPDHTRTGHARHRANFDAAPRSREMGSGLELLARHKDGHTFRVEISLSPLDTPEGRLVMAAVRDVSERHRIATERDRLRAEMELRHDRDRIAMDLHDGIIQSLYAVGLGLEIAVDQLVDGPTDAREQVDRSIEQMSRVVQDIRHYIYELRPTQFNGDLVASLQSLAADFDAASDLAMELRVPAVLAMDVPQEAALAMLHIAQEALTNTEKHAQASKVLLSLGVSANRLELCIADDGVGFELHEFSEEHRGLRNMRLRCELVGGAFQVVSRSGEGTMINISMPLEPALR